MTGLAAGTTPREGRLDLLRRLAIVFVVVQPHRPVLAALAPADGRAGGASDGRGGLRAAVRCRAARRHPGRLPHLHPGHRSGRVAARRIETIEAIRQLSVSHPQVDTTLGLSNISFGLKPAVRVVPNNNGYTVVNLGIKQPVSAILDAAEDQRADVIGMSGLLVKSTVVMKENLLEMNSRGIASTYPVILGGAALTRAYVEQTSTRCSTAR